MNICVVHLIREINGINPFKKFLNSYLKYKAGIDHNLLLVFKTNKKNPKIENYKNLVKGIQHQFLIIKDNNFDLGAYYLATLQTNYKYYCFLNSFSQIKTDEWLLKMYQYISKPNVGLVGSTGSFASITPRFKKDYLKYPNKFFKNLFNKKYFLVNITIIFFPIVRYFYNYFPNPHIRTNAFIVSREVFLKLKIKRIFFKFQAWYFESGRNNLTKIVEKMNLKVLVVDKNGNFFEKEKWFLSKTFRSYQQKNLMISDNQTIKFELTSFENKLKDTENTWGRLDIYNTRDK